MATFRNRYTDLADRGPDIFVTVARPLAIKVPEGTAVSDRRTDVRGLIDTGATMCGIRQAMAEDLGLQQFDEKPFGDSTGKTLRPVYLVDLIFDGDDRRHSVEAAGCTFGEQNMELVLGRNFLAIAQLNYNGPLGSYTLDF